MPDRARWLVKGGGGRAAAQEVEHGDDAARWEAREEAGGGHREAGAHSTADRWAVAAHVEDLAHGASLRL